MERGGPVQLALHSRFLSSVVDIVAGTCCIDLGNFFGYDLSRHPLYAHAGSVGGVGVDYAYDPLGRKVSER